MSTCDPTANAIVSGVYWVMYSKEYREEYDKRRQKWNGPPMQWSNRAFIAEWDQEFGWLLPGTEAGVADIIIIAGPLEAPYVHD
jgi:hypothetical protein